MDEPHVYAGVKSTHEAINTMNMGRLGPMPKSLGPPRPPGVVYPLAGSCACCERDETSAFDKGASLKKCSKCKLTRCVLCAPEASVIDTFTSVRYCGYVESAGRPITPCPC